MIYAITTVAGVSFATTRHFVERPFSESIISASPAKLSGFRWRPLMGALRMHESGFAAAHEARCLRRQKGEPADRALDGRGGDDTTAASSLRCDDIFERPREARRSAARAMHFTISITSRHAPAFSRCRHAGRPPADNRLTRQRYFKVRADKSPLTLSLSA